VIIHLSLMMASATFSIAFIQRRSVVFAFASLTTLSNFALLICIAMSFLCDVRLAKNNIVYAL
jgi:hypothetical protein